MHIGFFDSGVGGLTVLHEAMKFLRRADFLYYADTSHVPYGTKTTAQVRDYVFQATEFMLECGIDVMVVACNTATSVAIEELRAKYDVPIIGMEPAVKPAVENHKDKRILVTATDLTLGEDKLKQLITRLDCGDIIDLLPLPGLVTLAEKAEFDDTVVQSYLQSALAEFNPGFYQTVVLGCTHFIFYKKWFRKLLGPNIDIIDGNTGTVNKLLATLEDCRGADGGSGAITFYHSGAQVRESRFLEKYDALLKRLDEHA